MQQVDFVGSEYNDWSHYRTITKTLLFLSMGIAAITKKKQMYKVEMLTVIEMKIN